MGHQGGAFRFVNTRDLYPGYSGAQLRQLFINWAEKNPKLWQQPMHFGAVLALREAWPCK